MSWKTQQSNWHIDLLALDCRGTTPICCWRLWRLCWQPLSLRPWHIQVFWRSSFDLTITQMDPLCLSPESGLACLCKTLLLLNLAHGFEVSSSYRDNTIRLIFEFPAIFWSFRISSFDCRYRFVVVQCHCVSAVMGKAAYCRPNTGMSIAPWLLVLRAICWCN